MKTPSNEILERLKLCLDVLTALLMLLAAVGTYLRG